MIKRKHLFAAAFISIAILPILPIIFEVIPGRWPRIEVLLVICAVYPITIGTMAESTLTWAMIGVFTSIIFSYVFGLYATSTIYPPSLIEICITLVNIGFWVFMAWVLLKKTYMNDGKSLWGIKARN